VTISNYPCQPLAESNSQKVFSPSEPDSREIIVLNLLMSLAIGDSEVGEEYFNRKSLTPYLVASKENNTSFSVLPGLKKIIVSSSS